MKFVDEEGEKMKRERGLSFIASLIRGIGKVVDAKKKRKKALEDVKK